jgi:hypothetical protein
MLLYEFSPSLVRYTHCLHWRRCLGKWWASRLASKDGYQMCSSAWPYAYSKILTRRMMKCVTYMIHELLLSVALESRDAVQVTDPEYEESTDDILISNRNIAARKLYTYVVLACSLNVEVGMPDIILILVTTTQWRGTIPIYPAHPESIL